MTEPMFDPSTRISLSTEEMILIETRVASEKPSVGAAYLLWFFLWFVSAHRFYLGRPLSAVLQIASYFLLIGFVWLLVDLFLIPGMARARADRTRADLTAQMIAATRA